MEKNDHYFKGQTFKFTNYNGDKLVGEINFNYVDLSQGKNTWFFDKPLSCNVEIKSDGSIEIFWE